MRGQGGGGGRRHVKVARFCCTLHVHQTALSHFATVKVALPRTVKVEMPMWRYTGRDIEACQGREMMLHLICASSRSVPRAACNMLPLVGQAGLAWQAQRGGRRARERAREALLAAQPAAPAAQPAPQQLPGVTSELVSTLLKEWAWGEHSADRLQRLCHKAYNDQARLLRSLNLSTDNIDESLVAVARLGAWGKHPANVQRDLLRWLGDPQPPKAMTVIIPIKVAKPGRLPIAANVETGVLLPHAEFSSLYLKNREVFNKFMLGLEQDAPNTVEVFWQGCLERQDPRLSGHEMQARPRWRELAIPLALHGDAVACVAVGKPGTKSMDTVSWASVLSAGTTCPPHVIVR